MYEDEFNSDDEDYVAEDDDEEEEKDHYIDLTSPRRRNSRSGKPQQSPQNVKVALQNLLPGVDLSWMDKNQTPTPQRPLPRMSNKPKTSLPLQLQTANMLMASQQNTTGQYIKGLFECGICGTFFSTASQFLTHQDKAHATEKKTGMETFRCEICNFVLTNRFAYLEHKKMKHNKLVSFNCSKCKTSFSQLSDLQKHSMVCGSPACTTCGAVFKSWVEVGEHRIKVHNAAGSVTRQWLSCIHKTCQFKCLTQHEMQVHIRSKHMPTESYGCNASKCAKVFSTREALNEHKKEVHASEFIVQYQCVECKSCFSSKTLLAEHQYLHTMERLRKCDLCSRSFSTFTALRRHRDVHIIKGNFQCQTCSRWCRDKNELSTHICSSVRHNPNLRVYFCDVCQRDFRSDEKMFAHRKDHINFYQCGTCLKQCQSEKEYIKHRETHGKYTCPSCFEEEVKDMIEPHKAAHRYYVKLEDMDNNGKNEKVMFLCPNLLDVVKG